MTTVKQPPPDCPTCGGRGFLKAQDGNRFVCLCFGREEKQTATTCEQCRGKGWVKPEGEYVLVETCPGCQGVGVVR